VQKAALITPAHHLPAGQAKVIRVWRGARKIAMRATPWGIRNFGSLSVANRPVQVRLHRDIAASHQ